MKPLSKVQFSILASIMAASITTSAFAQRGQHGGGYGDGFSGGHGFGHASNGTRLSANLTVPANSTVQAQGEADYRMKGTSRGDIWIGVTLPVSGTPLLDTNAAAAAVLTVTLVNASSTTPYATCTLAITDIFWQYGKSANPSPSASPSPSPSPSPAADMSELLTLSSSQVQSTSAGANPSPTAVSANYQAIVHSNSSNSTTPVMARVGNCVNATNPSGTVDFPQVSAGDTLNVTLGDPSTAPILTGTFQ